MTRDKDPMVRMREVSKSVLANPWVTRAATALAMYEGTKQLFGTLDTVYREHLVYTVTIDEADHAYSDVHEWLLGQLPGEKQRALVASTVSRQDLIYADETEMEECRSAKVKLTFNDRQKKRFFLNGHRVTAQVERSENDKKTMPMSIEFSSYSKAGQLAVIEQIQKIQAQKGVRKPVLRIVNQWGNWVRRSDLPLRDLDSVILPKNQKDGIVEDLRAFLDAEEQYVKLALPWHRGYMLHGRPGTGKTSLIKALANEFKLDLWYVSLGDLKEEASLINLLSEVSPRSILLLEDVDTIQITHDRSEEQNGKNSPTKISLSSLLNALDGVATPHGLITFMTTNHFDRLDPALTRAGRMDRVEELIYPTATEADAMYRRFYGEPMPDWETGSAVLPVSQAELSEVFKRNLNDPEGASLALRAILEGGA